MPVLAAELADAAPLSAPPTSRLRVCASPPPVALAAVLAVARDALAAAELAVSAAKSPPVRASWRAEAAALPADASALPADASALPVDASALPAARAPVCGALCVAVNRAIDPAPTVELPACAAVDGPASAASHGAAHTARATA